MCFGGKLMRGNRTQKVHSAAYQVGLGGPGGARNSRHSPCAAYKLGLDTRGFMWVSWDQVGLAEADRLACTGLKHTVREQRARASSAFSVSGHRWPAAYELSRWRLLADSRRRRTASGVASTSAALRYCSVLTTMCC